MAAVRCDARTLRLESGRPPRHSSASHQSVEDRSIACRAMHLTTRFLVEAGASPLFVADTCTRQEPRRHLAEVVSEHTVDVFVVQCRVDAVAAVERFSRLPGHAAVDLTTDTVVDASATYPFT